MDGDATEGAVMPGEMRATRAAPDLDAGPSLWVSDQRALRLASARWRSLVVAALLSVAVGAALFVGSTDQRSSRAHRAHPGASTHKQGLFSLPGAAQGPVSQALGADIPAYRMRPSR